MSGLQFSSKHTKPSGQRLWNIIKVFHQDLFCFSFLFIHCSRSKCPYSNQEWLKTSHYTKTKLCVRAPHISFWRMVGSRTTVRLQSHACKDRKSVFNQSLQQPESLHFNFTFTGRPIEIMHTQKFDLKPWDVRHENLLSAIPSVPTLELVQLHGLVGDMNTKKQIISWLHHPGKPHEKARVHAHHASHVSRNHFRRLLRVHQTLQHSSRFVRHLQVLINVLLAY